MRWWMLAIAVMLAIPVQAGSPPQGDAAEATLPFNMRQSAAVWTGELAYVFGGWGPDGNGTDQIVAFDPSTNEVRLLDARMPERRMGLAAAWDGQAVYIFGGQENPPMGIPRDSTWPRTILRFDPATETVTIMPTLMPWSTYLATAAWDGATIDIFGGCGGNVAITGPCRVVRYDPVADNITFGPILPQDQPAPSFTQGPGAFAGDAVYLFSGRLSPGNESVYDGVFRYDPAADTFLPQPIRLVTGRSFNSASVAFDGQHILLFGGMNNTINGGGKYEDRIIIYDPVSGHSRFACLRLPSVSHASSAVFTGQDAYVFAADTATGQQVVRIEPVLLDCPGVAVGLPAASVYPLTTDRTLHALDANATTAVLEPAEGVHLTYACRVAPCDIRANVDVAATVQDLPIPVPVDAGALLYLHIEPLGPTPEARIRIELSAPEGSPAMAIDYFDGDSWVDLTNAAESGHVDGATAADDLVVFAAGYDEERRVAFAEVSHTSTYAISPHEAAAPGPASAAGVTEVTLLQGIGLIAALVAGAGLVAFLAVALSGRRGRKGT